LYADIPEIEHSNARLFFATPQKSRDLCHLLWLKEFGKKIMENGKDKSADKSSFG
jgi:hypothetical protein